LVKIFFSQYWPYWPIPVMRIQMHRAITCIHTVYHAQFLFSWPISGTLSGTWSEKVNFYHFYKPDAQPTKHWSSDNCCVNRSQVMSSFFVGDQPFSGLDGLFADVQRCRYFQWYCTEFIEFLRI